MLGVGDGVADDALEERLEDAAGLFVDHYGPSALGCGAERSEVKQSKDQSSGGEQHTGRDTLDASSARETTNGRLGDALDVVTENLAVTLRSAFAEALAAFSA